MRTSTEIRAEVRRRGGLVATFELHKAGFSRAAIRHAVSDGAVFRVRKGWYAEVGLAAPLARAVRTGGQLTCLSGVRWHGIWQYPTEELHVAVHREASRLRRPANMHMRLDQRDMVRVHWRDRESNERLLLPVAECLADLLRCQPAEIAMTAIDSALHQGLVGSAELKQVLDSLPARRRRLVPVAESRCESGTETLVRVRMFRLGVLLQPQVSLPGVGRVDFVAGERLVIEVDGEEYHTDPERFEADRRRDAELSRRGYRVLRFSYRMVLYDWPLVEAAILAALVRGDHLR